MGMGYENCYGAAYELLYENVSFIEKQHVEIFKDYFVNQREYFCDDLINNKDRIQNYNDCVEFFNKLNDRVSNYIYYFSTIEN